jgi:GMP synthase (glutamine-hydrolysing)
LAAKEKMGSVIKHLTNERIPTLGLCFGHQLIADVIGGAVTKDSSLAETGIAEISLTKAGKKDQLLQNMDECFPAVVGHKVSVTDLPDNCTKLAESDCCPIQAFRFQDVIYGFQFHPELTEKTLNDRLEMYPEYKDYDLENSFNQPIKAQQIIANAVDILVES